MDNLKYVLAANVEAGGAPSLPGTVVASGWIPFVVVLVLSFLFSAAYMRYFWSTRECDRWSAVTATFGLCIALLTSFLLPVDVFLVSYMKEPNGTFKDWATNETRTVIENSVLYSYITFYSIILVFVFFFLPLVYFAYEERDDDDTNCSQRFSTALKYTSVILLFALALLLLGVFLPYRKIPTNKNSTEWERIEFLLEDLYANKGQDALAFVLNVLTVIGMITLVIYTGFGLSAFPIGLVRGSRNLDDEKTRVDQRSTAIKSKIENLRNKQLTKALSTRDLSQLSKLEDDEHLVTRMNAHIQSAEKGYWYKLRPLYRIFEILLGVVGMLFGFLLWLSLLLSNIDKMIHSLGHDIGYATITHQLPNPLDYVMVQTQKVFPIDYIFFVAIIVFLVLCTISGIRYIGIWCFCVRMYKIRAHRTQPQGMIMLCVILMYTVLAFNILLFFAVPQYTTFGSQHYRVGNATTNGTVEIKPCSIGAVNDECYMTRASSVILRFLYKVWIFGVAYYWFMWAFLAASVIGFFIGIIAPRSSYLEEAVERDDFDETLEDERMLVP